MISENNIQVWKTNLYNAIKDLSDMDFQKDSWVGKTQKTISSFIEVTAAVVDDFDLKGYLQYYKSVNGEDKLYRLLFELNQMLDKYHPNMKDTLILRDPEWIAITNKAEEVVNLISLI